VVWQQLGDRALAKGVPHLGLQAMALTLDGGGVQLLTSTSARGRLSSPPTPRLLPPPEVSLALFPASPSRKGSSLEAFTD